MDTTMKSEITRIMRKLMEGIVPNIEEPGCLKIRPPIDDLRAACYEHAARRGYDLSPFEKYFKSALTLAALAYAHLDLPTRVYCAIFIAAYMYVDDEFSTSSGRPIEELELVHLLTHQGKFKDPAQEAWACLLRETSEHYPPAPASSMIVRGVSGLLNSMVMDELTKNEQLPHKAKEFATYSRRMSGGSEAFGTMIFPPDIPFTAYGYSLPYLVFFEDASNDVLSFYKEEMDGETQNRISLLSATEKVSKLEVLERFMEETVAAHKDIVNILKDTPKALEAYESFAYGYLRFYFISEERYRLGQLEL